MKHHMQCKPVGIIHSPYNESAPYQPLDGDSGEFIIEVNTEYEGGLHKLEGFTYIYILYWIDRLKKEPELIMTPPWAENMEVGLFASRSPARINPIGLSVVKILKIEGNRIHVSGLDVFNGTPLLDIKPYIRDLDTKEDASYGWLDELEDRSHLLLHIKGIPHDY